MLHILTTLDGLQHSSVAPNATPQESESAREGTNGCYFVHCSENIDICYMQLTAARKTESELPTSNDGC